MNIIFLTLSRFTSINDRGIYPDLVRQFCNEGHNMYVISPMERKFKKETIIIRQGNLTILKIKTLNIQKTSNIEKGMGYILLEYQFIKAVKKFFGDVTFDLILYSTPPITFSRVVKFIKARDSSVTYLLLKDIFPQAGVDSRLFKQGGLIYNFFRTQEKDLYKHSDFIGCMSPANAQYILEHNPEILPQKVEVNPNSIELFPLHISDSEKKAFRIKHNIKEEAVIFVYGGNLGKSQGIEFYLEIMKRKANDSRVFFVTVGSGSEFRMIERFIEENKLTNSILMGELPKDDYERMLLCCNVGLIFLSPIFSIPNFPSRVLSYMERELPILAATDVVTDIGTMLEENNAGLWCESGDIDLFMQHMERLIINHDLREQMGRNAYQALIRNFLVGSSVSLILEKQSQQVKNNSLRSKEAKTIVFINQSSGYLMIDIVNAFEDVFEERVLMAGLLNKRDKDLHENVKREKLVAYKRGSSLNRYFSWPFSFLQALIIIKMKYREAHLFLVSNPPLTSLLPLFCKNPFYLLIYDVYPDALVEYNFYKESSWVVRIWKRMNRKVYPQAKRIFTLTQGMQQSLMKYSGGKEVEIVPIWTDNEFLKPIPKKENVFIQKLELIDKFVVLYSGNIGLAHHVDVLVELARINQNPDIVFLIIGQGHSREKVRKLIEMHNLSNCILLPWQDTNDFPMALAAADLAVVSLGKAASKIAIPSKFYNYLSVGAPIMCVSEGSSELSKMVRSLDVGKDFEPYDLEGMNSFIGELMDKPQLRAQYHQNSITASKTFTSKNTEKFKDKVD